MVLPVLGLYVGKIPNATPILIGLASGIYGFTQALMQLPCGILSDYVGRKPVIIGGLVIFIIGSLIAAFGTSIWALIVGRAIQGAGAIGSPILALVADATREEVRTRAMAFLGISIGATFIFAIILGPLLDAYFGLWGIFAFTALLASVGILFLLWLGQIPQQKPQAVKGSLYAVLTHPELWRLNLNIFMLHAILTACFLLLPQQIEAVAGLTHGDTWQFYLPILAMSLVLVAPFLRYADKNNWQKKLMKAAIVLLGFAILSLAITTDKLVLLVATTLFFVAFNYLEASLPAMVSRMAPKQNKGSALGLYAFSQFLGMFTGGVAGGCLLQWAGPWAIGFGSLFLTMVGWLILSNKMRSEQWQEASIK